MIWLKKYNSDIMTRIILLVLLICTIANLQAQTVTDVVTGLNSDPYGLGSFGNTLFIGLENGAIYTIDTTEDAPVPQLLYDAPSDVYGLVLSGNDLYFSQYMSNSIYKIDITETNPTMTEVLSITGEPFDFVLVGNELYFTDMTENNIYKFDITDTNPEAELLVSGLWYPAGIAVYGDYIYYTETFSATVSRFDYTTDTVVAETVASVPYGFGIDFVGSTLYVTLNQLNAIAMLDVSDSEATPTNFITTGIEWPIALAENNGELFISESDGGLVSKVSNILHEKEFTQNSTVQLYPNPAHNSFSLNTNATEVTIYQSNGSIAATYQGEFSKTHTFDISTLAPGLYLVAATNHKQTENLKLVLY